MDKNFPNRHEELCVLDDTWFRGDDCVEFVGKITNEDTLLMIEKIKAILEANKDD